MLFVMVLLGVVAGLVRPRRARFGTPRAVAVVFAAAVAQIVSVATSGAVHTALLAASVALGALWIALQRRHLASVLLGVGAALNVAVVAANGGMPVDSAALARVGRRDVDVTRGFLYKHVPMTSDTRLSWLGDRIPVPIQRNVISVGDVLMAVAICLWVADGVGSWWNDRRSAGPVHGEHGSGPGCEVVGDSE
ncbi:MAG TPA: DUF5317 family protein [Ilumatobacteraceae bacterium]|nr:DUF5317 family protein [Ilumatobacteraceae bacterium]